MRVWLILDPQEEEQLLAPVTPDCETVQEYVVPATVLLRASAGLVKEQIAGVAFAAEPTGFGFTVTVAVMAEPVQEAVAGVME